jgi:hypothetical protein
MPHNYRRMLESLDAANVDFLIVGGWAVISHGYVRTTKDLDIWIEAEMHESRKVIHVLNALGYPTEVDTIMRLSVEKSVLRLDHEPMGIDLMTSCDGCHWSTAWRRRQIVELDGITVPILSLRDLRAAKRAAGRYRDLDDLENLPPCDDAEPDPPTS